MCKNNLSFTDRIINDAKKRFPCSISFLGTLAPVQIEKIEKECKVMVMSVYMGGQCRYSIWWKGGNRSKQTH